MNYPGHPAPDGGRIGSPISKCPYCGEEYADVLRIADVSEKARDLASVLVEGQACGHVWWIHLTASKGAIYIEVQRLPT
jgi:hypothetical protein